MRGSRARRQQAGCHNLRQLFPRNADRRTRTHGMSAVLALVCSASALLSSSSTQMVHESSGHRAQERRQRDGRRRADSYAGEQRAA